MADADLQALLDVGETGRGIRIVSRSEDTDVLSHYYCVGNVTGVGKAMWVPVTTLDTDEDKDVAIRAAFGVA